MDMDRSQRKRSSLASEIIFEILSWATLETLMTCRMVCKEWKRITGGSNFTDQHILRSRMISGYLVQVFGKFSPLIGVMQAHAQMDLPLDFVSSSVAILASSNQGLLCCHDGREAVHLLCVCKPTTRQIQRIPNPDYPFSIFDDHLGLLVISNNPLHYKIIRWSESPRGGNKVQFDVFDSEAWAWKSKGKFVLPYLPRRMRGFPVLVRGVFHWMMPDNKHILSIDGYNESWAFQDLPPAVCVDDDDCGWKKSQVAVVGGMLGVVRKEGGDGTQWEVWVVEETGGAWRKWGVIPSPWQGTKVWFGLVALNFHWTPGISNLGFRSNWEPWVEA